MPKAFEECGAARAEGLLIGTPPALWPEMVVASGAVVRGVDGFVSGGNVGPRDRGVSPDAAARREPIRRNGDDEVDVSPASDAPQRRPAHAPHRHARSGSAAGRSILLSTGTISWSASRAK